MIATTRCKGGRISIHALREEGDGSPSSRWITVFRFLSTPSARRATPCRRARYQTSQISIHALREEGDRLRFVFLDDDFGFLSTPSARRATNEMVKDCWAEKFLSTPSARRATHIVGPPSKNRVISIHALREEGDLCCLFFFRTGHYFYPRPPRGGRPTARPIIKPCSVFLSTPSARRATYKGRLRHVLVSISIHALREEGDFAGSLSGFSSFNFYPRPPRGGRQV